MLKTLAYDIFGADLQRLHSKRKLTMQGVNTNMLIIAREARSLNQYQLALKMGMSPTNLSKIERGSVQISTQALQAIAAITGYPEPFFQQPGDILPPHLRFRRRQQVAQRYLAAINARTNIIARHVQFLTNALDIPVPPLRIYEDDDTPQAAAIRARAAWQMERGPVANVASVLEGQGIVLAGFDFNTPRVDSKSLYTAGGQPVIFFNSTQMGDRQRFTLAFELGQLLLGGEGSRAMETNILHEANAFAAEWLMPESDIRPDFEPGITIAVLAALKKKWKVSMIALLYRADDLGYLTPNQKRYLLQQFNSGQIRRREPPKLDVPPEQPRLLQQWVQQYRMNNQLSIAAMAAVLCLHPQEFMELYIETN